MLDLSWGHIFLVLVVALVVVGPKELPRLMRTIGQWMGKARAMADQFRKSFDDMARQSELDELRKEIENLRHERPLAGLEKDLNRSILPDDMRAMAAAPPGGVSIEPESAETVPPPTRSGESDFVEPREGELAVSSEPVTEPVGSDGYTPPTP